MHFWKWQCRVLIYMIWAVFSHFLPLHEIFVFLLIYLGDQSWYSKGFHRTVDRNRCSFWLLPEGAFPPALEFLQFVCIRFPFQGWWHGPSRHWGVPASLKWWLRAVTQKYLLPHVCPGHANFSQVMNELLVSEFRRAGFPFLSPHPPYSLSSELNFCLRLNWVFKNSSLKKKKKKKFWLVKTYFPLSKLLKEMVIWGCEPVEAGGIQSSVWH